MEPGGRYIYWFSCEYSHMFQVHPELAAVPEQHDGRGLYDGSGCRVSSGDRRPSRPSLSISCSVPGISKGVMGICNAAR